MKRIGTPASPRSARPARRSSASTSPSTTHGGNDYLGFYSGDNGTAANRPQLVVTYQ